MSITWFFVAEMKITTIQVLVNVIHDCSSVFFPSCLLLQLFVFLCGLEYFFSPVNQLRFVASPSERTLNHGNLGDKPLSDRTVDNCDPDIAPYV